MTIVNTKKMLADARLNNYAVGAYNVFNLESIRAVIKASREMNLPVIIQASESAVKYAGAVTIVNIIKEEAKDLDVPIAIHLDHGKSYEMVEKCIKAGFTSVMIDASSLPYEENVKLTRKVVKLAHKHKVTVEAELGEIKGIEDNVSSENSHLTDPHLALEFIRLTGVDSLAVSIGTAHGINKGTTAPKIRYDILERLENILPINFPLVCHGASSVDDELKGNFINSGGVLTKAQGISHADLKRLATTTPVSKINVDTDLRLVFTTSIRETLKTNPEIYDPRKHMKNVVENVKNRIIFSSTKLFR